MSARLPDPAHDSSHGATPMPAGPCDLYSERYSEDIHLLVDRELGEAEAERVERHLQECGRCLALAQQLERMSSVLKAWDLRETEGPVPNERLRRAVLAQVAEQSARRRRDTFVLRGLHVATAAVVLLGLGVAAALGLATAPEQALAPAVTVDRSPWPLEAHEATAYVSAAAAPAVRLDASDLVAGVQPREFAALRGDPGVLTDESMRAFSSGDSTSLAALDARRQRLAAFQERLGAEARYWNGPAADGASLRMLPESTYRYLSDSGKLALWLGWSTPRSSTIARPSDTPVAARATGMHAKDMLGQFIGVTDPFQLPATGQLAYVPGVAPAGAPRSGKPPRSVPPALVAHAIPDSFGHGLGLTSGPIGDAKHSFLDPLEAWANGQLRLEESNDELGTVVAFVRGTTKPIYLPAGQFISDGFGDRVVCQPTWLPASKDETLHSIRCYLVQRHAEVEARGAPQLSPLVVGPSVRALLASGAGREAVKAAAQAICAAWSGPSFNEWDWSLRDFYESSTRAGNRSTEAAYADVRWGGSHGFIALDSRGHLLGFELVRLTGPAAEELLRRLWLGYVIETVWRPRLGAALASPGDLAKEVMSRLADYPVDFRAPGMADATHGARVSTLTVDPSGLHMHALEVGGKPAVVSGLTAPEVPAERPGR
ncbi:MAG: anti-sigma factor [Planctomycetota bacterium]|nr:anti-sigma factor [Planctomycetota bacterium]